jgi:hypothetical protein
MNTKSIHFGLGRIGLAVTGLLIATLNLCAESSVTAHIPFEFAASGKSLPAGDYTIEPIEPGVVLIMGAERSQRALLLVATSGPSLGPAGITFNQSGVLPQLTSVQTSTGTWQFLTSPGSKAGPAAVALRSKK